MTLPVGMIQWDKFQNALAQWAESVGVPMIWEGQSNNPTMPERPYVSLQLLSVDRFGQDGSWSDTSTFENQNLISTAVYGQRKLVFTVQVFAFETGKLKESAIAYCQALKDNLEADSIWQSLNDAGLALADHSETKNLAELSGQQFIGRAAFDVQFNGAAESVDAIRTGAVEAMFVSGQIYSGGDAPLPGAFNETPISVEAENE